MKDYLNRLESALLDLGAEVYAMKSQVRDLKDHRHRFEQIITALRGVLDEKGILSEEDFELALTSSGVKEVIDDSVDAKDERTFKRTKENLPH